MRPPTWAELRAASDEKLIEDHDYVVGQHGIVGARYFLEELARRRTDRLTNVIKWLTVANTGLVLVSAFLVAWDVLRA